MSDDVLRIIPRDITFVPTPEGQAKAVEKLEEILPDGEMCNTEVYEDVTFIDCGGNLERISCPACGKDIEIDYFEENDPGTNWWYEVTDKLQTAKAQSLETKLPCCNAVVPFTQIKFDWPAGFSMFELSIYNPNIDRNLNDAELSQLETVLGCSLSQVRAHY